MLVDTHAHLYWESYQGDLDQVVKKAMDAGVGLIINVGVDVEKSQQALKQLGDPSLKSLEVYSSIGIHPHEASKYLNNPDESIHQDIEKLKIIYQSNPEKVKAVGECGLDFLFESSPDVATSSLALDQLKDLQRKLFQAQIELAKKLDLPLLVHVRDDRIQDPENSQCWDEALEMLKDHYGILHCYSGLNETTQKALKLNFLISFAANITYPKNEYLRKAAEVIPLDKIVLETDSPFLSPQSSRGKRNEPAAVLESAKLIAEIKGISFDQLADQTTLNIRKLLKLA